MRSSSLTPVRSTTERRRPRSSMHEDALPRVWAARHSRQRRLPRGPWSTNLRTTARRRPDGRASHRARSRDSAEERRRQYRWFCHRSVHDPRGGRGARGVPRLEARRQRHRRELRHRRRAHQDDVSRAGRNKLAPRRLPLSWAIRIRVPFRPRGNGPRSSLLAVLRDVNSNDNPLRRRPIRRGPLRWWRSPSPRALDLVESHRVPRRSP